jgi:hypothetical protein
MLLFSIWQAMEQLLVGQNECNPDRNRMVQIPYNFQKTSEKHRCECNAIEDMAHIYNCEMYCNKQEERISYDSIFNGNLNEQIKVFTIFKQNFDQREKMIDERNSPCDPCDPLL